MRKITLFVLLLVFAQYSFGQIINEPANWPNSDWTTYGNYGAAGLLADPATDSSFSFDDDATGSTSDDDIASESPIIDLTPAYNGSENQIVISGNYNHNDIGGVLSVDYWDADSSSWVSVLELGDTSADTSNWCGGTLVVFETGFDIGSFSANQLSNFKYRFSYDDADGWQWGWCINNVSLISNGGSAPNCDAVVTSPADGDTSVLVNSTVNWNSASGFPDGYYFSLGTSSGGTDILDSVDVGNVNSYDLANLDYSTTYYITILPYNGSGSATDSCTSYSFTTQADPNTTVDCNGGPVTTTFCYDTGLENSYSFISSDGGPLNLTIDSGEVENGWDELIILDSDGTELYNGYGNGGDVSGISFQSSGDNITLVVQEDGSISCVSSASIDPITMTVSCATCVNPTVDFGMVSDCLNAPQFYIDVDVTDLGSAGSLTISDNQGSADVSASTTGTYQFGPYANNTDVQINVANDDDANCFANSGSMTQDYCAVTLVDCAAGPMSTSYCYGNNDTTQFEYVSSDGSPLNLTIDSGVIENGWDELLILDSDGVTQLYYGYGNAGNISGLTFQSSGDTIYFAIQSDGSISCGSGSAAYAGGIDYTVACATCTNPVAEYTVIDDCANGDQFLIDVNIISMGDAQSLTISDNYGTATGQATETGVVQMGPYPFFNSIEITVSNDQDVNCVIGSNPILMYSCPPENDNCDQATVITPNSDSSCTESASGNLVGATPSPEGNTCGGSDDDDVWFEFTATSENHAITIYNIVGNTQDLYHVLYEGSQCDDLTQIYCSDADDSVANGLTIGNTYSIRVYSYTAALLDYLTFDICVYTIPPPITTSATEYTVEEIVTEVLINSECNQAFNVTYSTGTDYGSTNGIGYFESNGSTWPFESGLIMTSGDIANAVGPESGVVSDGTYAWVGDADLEAAIPGLNAGDTNNASILEFDFVPVTDHMSFDFIFAAEEYGTFQCTFTDAFAFLLTDTAGVTTNLAIVPGTTDAISVLSVRDDEWNASCPSVNEEFFGNYYGPGGLAPLTSPTNFIGHTIPMTAEADVIPNELYHIKLIVADDGDTLYDSAVFIDAGSFDIGTLDLGEDILLSSGNALCQGQEMTLNAGGLPNNSTIAWYMDGNLIEGENGVNLTVSETAFYSATITIDNTDCAYSDEILVEFFPTPNISAVEDNILKCANESYTLEVDVANSAQMNSLTYIWSLDGVDLQWGSDNTYNLDEIAEESGEFIVTVFDDTTYCWGQTTIQVDFYENSYCIDLPQGLSPNGDGYNDCLVLDHLEDREDIDKIEVFNRYGAKVYELNEYIDQWCGRDQDNEELPVGTYFYIIYFNSDKEPITSWIYLNY